jgi:hypothetical protein
MLLAVTMPAAAERPHGLAVASVFGLCLDEAMSPRSASLAGICINNTKADSA